MSLCTLLTLSFMIKYCFLFFLSIALCSCRTYKLSKQDLAWNPYTSGQKLEFKNEKGATKIYYISDVNQHLIRTNVYAGSLSSKLEELVVHLSEEKNPKYPKEQSILAITRSTDKSESIINFLIDLKGFRFPAPVGTISELKGWQQVSLRVNGKKYEDVYEFPREGKDQFNSSISKIYWSKSKGIIRIEFKSEGTFDLL